MSNKFLTSIKEGFTLSEILLTLGIIGVVAIMTIIPLIESYQKNVYITGLKKAYLGFNLALTQLTYDKGTPGNIKASGIMDTGTTQMTFGTEIVKYFNVLKNCQTTSNMGCFTSSLAGSYDGTDSRSNYDNAYYKFITTDNIAYRIDNFADNCNSAWSSGATHNMDQTCGTIYIDVNGPNNGPNNLGRDVFRFWITNGKGAQIYPYGGVDDNGYGSNRWWRNPTSGNIRNCYPGSTIGGACGARVIEEGWAMNY